MLDMTNLAASQQILERVGKGRFARSVRTVNDDAFSLWCQRDLVCHASKPGQGDGLNPNRK